MPETEIRRLRVAIPAIVAALAFAIVYTLVSTPASLGWMVARAAALFGYTALFLAILSTEYLTVMRKLFGKPFLTVHHIIAVTGLVLIVLHPLTVAFVTRDATVFVPQMASLAIFLTNGGRVALPVLLIAILAAVLHARIKNVWVHIHRLVYLTFLLAFVHSWLLGSNVATGILHFLWPLMAGVATGVFVQRRTHRPVPERTPKRKGK